MKSPAADRDTGLLSPVRAGTPVERAVSDQAWLQAMLDTEAALARAGARLGSVPEQAAAVITAAARAESVNPRDIAVRARGSADTVAELIGAFTRVVAKLDPDAAPYVHRGATSQDILATAAMLVCGRALPLVRRDLQRVRTALPGGRGWALGGRRAVEEADGRLALLAGDALTVVLHDADSALTTAFATETGLTVADAGAHAEPTDSLPEVGRALTRTVRALAELATAVGAFTEAGTGSAAAGCHARTRGPVELIHGAALQVPALCAVLEPSPSVPGARYAVWQPLREAIRLTGGAAHTAARLTEDLDATPRTATPARVSTL
ncbi:lyase family protein [Streptomyces griseofuscus]|uniref:hypothetical protein n=1 Tax=Streptomyces griseofuscus TaxID=146922 RepID=UPI003426C8D3